MNRPTAGNVPAIRALALALVLALAPGVAQADCIARSLNALGVVQAGDAFSTSGPVLQHFPGGFVTQDQKVVGCVPVGSAPGPGGPCAFYEADPIARRSGCVSSNLADVACATAVNLALRASEYAALRHAPPRTRRVVCTLNYAVALGYMALIWPNNLRTDFDLAAATARSRRTPSLVLRAWRM